MDRSELKKIKKGDKNILAKYLIGLSKGFYRIAYAITGNVDDAEDAISNTTLKICEKIYSLEKPEYFKTWATRILINECKDLLRKNSRSINMDEFTENNIESNEINYVSLAIKSLVNKMEEDHKEIIILYYFDDYSVSEISKILNIAEGTVKSRLSRARSKLYEILNKEGEYDVRWRKRFIH